MFVRTAVFLAALVAVWASDQPACADGRHVIVHLFSWKWTDIAAECERFLGDRGFCGVQVSPPHEHRVMTGAQMRPWFERYQPASYRLESRSGTRAEFVDMVERCNAVNVRIYVDMVVNHMLEAIAGSGTASGGSTYDASSQSFPVVPYGPNDFNPCHQCAAECLIQDYSNAIQVRNCRLNHLLDIKLGEDYPRTKVVEYFNDLVGIGVAGFRVDAAKHMWPGDLQIMYGQINNLNTRWFQPNTKPFMFQEVIDMGGEAISATEYIHLGRVTEFKFCRDIGRRFRGLDELKYLREMGPQWGWLNSDKAVTFVDNHDNQRGHGGAGSEILTHRDPRPYKMATAFKLAHPYAFTRIMSSYQFTEHWEGPPHNPDWSVKDVTINPDGTCGNGWICEHRWRQIFNMVKFRNVAGNASLVYWQDVDNHADINSGNQIAFARETKGFVAFNNHNANFFARLQTTLPEGTYCDVISGDAMSGICTGESVYVSADGMADIFISNTSEDPMIAIHEGSRIGAGVIFPSPPPPILTRTVVLLYAETQPGQDLFLRGGIDHNIRPGCTSNPETSWCSLNIIHDSLGTSSHYDKYNAWRVGDNFLDWYGAEAGQGSYQGTPASGSPTVWTTNDTDHAGYQPINTFGPNYWLFDVVMDCALDEKGWFDLKGFEPGVGWESNINQAATCTGTAGGSKPYQTTNHIARCGHVNIFEWNSNECIINSF